MAMKVTGLSQMKAAVTAVARALPRDVAAALRAEAEIEMAEAKRRTPVDTGVLRGSGYVDDPTLRLNVHRIEVGFGGAAAEYAVVVHEDMDAFHPVGQAKYLESVLKESAPYLAERIGRRITLG